MRPSFRIGVGFVLGCILSMFAFAHAGVGHGSYTPLVANAPMLVLIPEIGILVAFFGTPFLWAAYFLWIPEIRSGTGRSVAVVLAALAHVGTGAWMASRDSYLQRTFGDEPWSTVLYFALLIAGVVMLGVLALRGTKRVRDTSKVSINQLQR